MELKVSYNNISYLNQFKIMHHSDICGLSMVDTWDFKTLKKKKRSVGIMGEETAITKKKDIYFFIYNSNFKSRPTNYE